jgi:hypothetical protein
MQESGKKWSASGRKIEAKRKTGDFLVSYPQG